MYVADSESTDKDGYGNNPGWKRGIRVGSAKDGSVVAFIPDPSPGTAVTSAAEGVAADAEGNILWRRSGPEGREEIREKVAFSVGSFRFRVTHQCKQRTDEPFHAGCLVL
jgi:hypothetical protein